MGLLDFFNKQKYISELKREVKLLKKENKKIHATSEGSHSDILNTSITGTLSTEATEKKSMYKTWKTTPIL